MFATRPDPDLTADLRARGARSRAGDPRDAGQSAAGSIDSQTSQHPASPRTGLSAETTGKEWSLYRA